MRVLFLSPRQAWPINSGAKLREYHLARQLASEAEVTILSFAAESDALRDGLSFCHHVETVPPPPRYTPWKLALGLLSGRPLPIINYTTPEMRHALAKLLREKQFDIVQIEGTNMADYVSQIQQAPGSPRVVYDWHNIESELMLRYAEQTSSLPRKFYARHTAHLLETVERDMLRSGSAHLVCSVREQQALQQLAPNAPIHVVANGVDTGYFQMPTSPNRSGSAENRILFVGTMDYHANIVAASAFAYEVWPRLHASMPHLRLTLVGANPTAEVRALAGIPGIEVTGTVPDIRPYYETAVASIVPLKTGGGTRLKILEAMAAGVPVISTAVGAEGLAVRHGENILIAESSEEWISALIRLRDDPAFARNLSHGARNTVERLYDWNVIGADLTHIFRDLLDARGKR